MKTFLLITGLALNILIFCFPYEKFAKEEAPVTPPLVELNDAEPLDTGATSYSFLLKAQAADLVAERKD